VSDAERQPHYAVTGEPLVGARPQEQAAHGQMDVYLVAAPDADVAGTVLPLIHDADRDFARNYDVSDTSVFAIRPDGYLAIAAGGVVDTDELVRHLKATFR
jgi:hypothetical protein